MANVQIENQDSTDTKPSRGSTPLLLIGTFLWVLCLLVLIAGWYQWRAMNKASAPQPSVSESSQEEVQPQKKMKLVLQKDGSYVAQEVTDEEDANPWDAEGIEDFSLTDTNNQTVTKNDLLGKPFVISFVFTHCRGPCPNVTLQMRELQDRLKDYDFNLVSLTVDPERDTIEVLKNYGKENGADFDRWKFLTGNQAQIYWLIHHSFKMPVEEAKDERRLPGFEIIHSTNIMLVNAEGRVTGKYNAQKDDEMSKLRRDLKKIAKPKVAGLESATPTRISDGKDDN